MGECHATVPSDEGMWRSSGIVVMELPYGVFGKGAIWVQHTIIACLLTW